MSGNINLIIKQISIPFILFLSGSFLLYLDRDITNYVGITILIIGIGVAISYTHSDYVTNKQIREWGLP